MLLMMSMPFLMFYFINFIWLERSILMLSKCISLCWMSMVCVSFNHSVHHKNKIAYGVSHTKLRNIETIFFFCFAQERVLFFSTIFHYLFSILFLLQCLSFQFYGLCLSLAWNRIKEPKKMLHIDINTINLFGTSFIHTHTVYMSMPFLLLFLILFNFGSENGPFKWCGINGWMDGV